ncbi:acyl-CoA dehydrogenase family protein [Simplicispira psychrophila]|uniref:acyl-CoA dehydrogenase family protein n=1 Tax=Simplicispira psychrophila TaxID=80882 RepID=UPI0004880C5F|nr:acyl-CoA dehydrogenase family protein [Simplicispira psychrophila]
MNLQETEVEKAFRTSVRAWMAANLCGEFEPLRNAGGLGSPGYEPALAKRWEQHLAQGGWTGLGWPRAHGGRELPLAQQVIFHEEYARCGGPRRLGHIGETLLAPTLMAHGSSELQARFLPGILAGETYWAQGYSEPGAGSDLAAVRTRARIDPETGEWVIDGQKVWTSWAQESDWIFVLARSEAGSVRHKGLVLLLVPLRQAGVTIRPIRQITGDSEFNEVFLDGARTEGTLSLGAPGQGWAVAMYLLGCERGASTLGQQAHFKSELEQLITVAQRNGAVHDPLLRQRLAHAALGLETLRSHALRTSGDGAPPRAASISKYVWSNWRRALGELAMDVLGREADIDAGDPLHRTLQHLWLESRSDTLYAGSNEIQLNMMAERALQMPR